MKNPLETRRLQCHPSFIFLTLSLYTIYFRAFWLRLITRTLCMPKKQIYGIQFYGVNYLISNEKQPKTI